MCDVRGKKNTVRYRINPFFYTEGAGEKEGIFQCQRTSSHLKDVCYLTDCSGSATKLFSNPYGNFKS